MIKAIEFTDGEDRVLQVYTERDKTYICEVFTSGSSYGQAFELPKDKDTLWDILDILNKK
jgi:hypothetical protein